MQLYLAFAPAPATAAVALAGLGLIILFLGTWRRLEARRLARAPLVRTGEAASRGAAVAAADGTIAVQGRVRCSRELLSPVTHTPCLYYELRVIGSWQDGDRRRRHTLVEERKAARIFLDDGSGSVRVVADGGGRFEGLRLSFAETRELHATELPLDTPLSFGGYVFHNPAGSLADSFLCEERVLTRVDSLFACGAIDGRRQIGGAPRATLILSRRDRDALLGATLRKAHRMLIGGGVATAAAALLGLVGVGV